MFMDEMIFSYDADQVAAASSRFPAHRLPTTSGRPDADLTYMTTARNAEFGRHVWDESGH